MDRTTQIYPSDVIAAIDAYKKRISVKTNKPIDKIPAHGAFRLNYDRKTSTTFTDYIPFEVNLVDNGWTAVSLKFFNLTHVGRISALEGDKNPRNAATVKAISLLFKEDYIFERRAKKNGKSIKIIEKYGFVKELINKSYQVHVKKEQKSKTSRLPNGSAIIPLVKHTRNVGEGQVKKQVPIDGPGNINIGLKFMTEKGKQPDQTDPNLTFRAPILDARFDRENLKPGEWTKDDAKLPDGNGVRCIPVNNGNIHEFIRGGSLISGIDNMGAVCLSQGKISLPSKLDLCIVRPTKPQRVSQTDFDDDDMATINDVTDPEPPADEYAEPPKPVQSNSGEYDEIESEKGESEKGESEKGESEEGESEEGESEKGESDQDEDDEDDDKFEEDPDSDEDLFE